MLAFEDVFMNEMIQQIFGVFGNDLLVVVTAVLVGVTGFYAWQTRRKQSNG